MQIMMHDVMCMNDICINYGFYEKSMNDICCGISKHIHLEEDVDALLGDFWLLSGTKRMETLLLKEKKDILDSSDALSDQVLSLDIC